MFARNLVIIKNIFIVKRIEAGRGAIHSRPSASTTGSKMLIEKLSGNKLGAAGPLFQK